ncbi:thiamine phosphate synthase [Lactobacillus sp.] [Lactiplantibacillus mudanjiangensis]|uniref:thiamine phosphate synthase n=1 Tax=Lactiplantibacillus mudanjiangensis TaxID=1296538 RepID=UPI001014E3ED|nr:thiamine phosphate synthase [Lactobacillus sp.] [Lactiplantibacillus mudanjiangensis]
MTINFNPAQLQVYLVAGTQDVPGRSLVTVVQQALASGITAFQFRDKGASQLTATERLALGRQLKALCTAKGVPFIVDDDVDLALAIGADGIHVGQSDDQIQHVLQRVQGRLFVGLSCSTLTEIQQANRLTGLAYIGSGPIFPTTSKADADPVVGLKQLKQLVQTARVPIVAIGGITESQLPAIRRTGAAGSAVISMVTQSPNIQRTVRAMLSTGVTDDKII